MLETGQGLLVQLRSVTRDRHRQLDSHSLLKGLVTPCEPENYAKALAALHAPLSALDRQISSGVLRTAIHYRYASRLEDLDHDLKQLGVLPFALGLNAPPEPQDASELIGYLYVQEGARLGSAVLARKIPNGWPARFLRQANGTTTWQGFIELTSCLDIDPEIAVGAACRAFDVYIQHLDQLP